MLRSPWEKGNSGAQMKTPAIYGGAPVDLGRVNIDSSEMLYWLYCPIKLPGTTQLVPPNLQQFDPIIKKAVHDAYRVKMNTNFSLHQSYVYITAKRMWVNGSTANRPGWHSDGFLTDDLNYIWMDSSPTVFCVGPKVAFTADHDKSMPEMNSWAESRPYRHVVYPVKHLLRLDQSCIHKVDENMTPGVRTFVKISISSHPYALNGNSINHELRLRTPYFERKTARNCPATG